VIGIFKLAVTVDLWTLIGLPLPLLIVPLHITEVSVPERENRNTSG